MAFSCQPTRQRDALLVARLPLAVLIHHAAFAAGLLVTDEGRVVLGANVVLHHGSLRGGKKLEVKGQQSIQTGGQKTG